MLKLLYMEFTEGPNPHRIAKFHVAGWGLAVALVLGFSVFAYDYTEKMAYRDYLAQVELAADTTVPTSPSEDTEVTNKHKANYDQVTNFKRAADKPYIDRPVTLISSKHTYLSSESNIVFEDSETITVKGRDIPGFTIVLSTEPAVQEVSVATDASGLWEVTLPKLSGGANLLKAVATNNSGVKSDETPLAAIIINPVEAAAPTPSNATKIAPLSKTNPWLIWVLVGSLVAIAVVSLLVFLKLHKHEKKNRKPRPLKAEKEEKEDKDLLEIDEKESTPEYKKEDPITSTPIVSKPLMQNPASRSNPAIASSPVSKPASPSLPESLSDFKPDSMPHTETVSHPSSPVTTVKITPRMSSPKSSSATQPPSSDGIKKPE